MNCTLVTGGAGFIGSNLVEFLKSTENKKIYVIDNYSTGSIANHIEGVEYLAGDTKNVFSLIPAGVKIDEIYHLGEYSRVEQSFEDLEKVWEANSAGTFQILQYARENNSKLLYAGSSTKFGDGGLGRNQSPYGWIKAANTDLVKNFGAWFGLNHVIVYFYNGYGPREISTGKYATLIAKFKENMISGVQLPVVMPGTQRRNFTHVNDLVAGIYLAQKKGSGDGYGIGADENYSVLEVAELFGGKVQFLPERNGNRMGAEVHNEKIKKLGWKQEHKLEEYIQSLRGKDWE